MNYQKFLLCLCLITPESLLAKEPISVAGLNLFMTPEQIISVAKKKQLRCYPTEGSGVNSGSRGYSCCKSGICRGFNDGRGISFRFKKGTKIVNQIDISCRVTNSCGMEIGDIARILIKKKIVEDLSYEVVPIIDVNLGRYRGKGPLGDEITVNPNLHSAFLDSGITLRFSRKISRDTTF